MAERPRFPRANLNAAAQPWGRQVERLVRQALTRLDQMESGLSGTQTTAVRALRRLGANPDIYRDEGIVANAGEEFAVFTGEDRDEDSSLFSSLNVQPEKATIRHTDTAGRTGYVMVGGDGFSSQGVRMGIGSGSRWTNFADGKVAISMFLDDNGNPTVMLAQGDAPLLTLGYEDPVANSSGGYDEKPYMQWVNDTTHRIYGFGDLVGASAVPAGDESTPGRVQFATDAETIAGTIAGKATTPRGVKKAIAAALTSSTPQAKSVADYYRGAWVQP